MTAMSGLSRNFTQLGTARIGVGVVILVRNATWRLDGQQEDMARGQLMRAVPLMIFPMISAASSSVSAGYFLPRSCA